MKITIQHFEREFNVCIASREGREPFLTIRGCRLVDGQKGSFVSWPARKNEQTGKWWNHVTSSDEFTQAVIDEVMKTAPAKRPAAPAQHHGADEDIPF